MDKKSKKEKKKAVKIVLCDEVVIGGSFGRRRLVVGTVGDSSWGQHTVE